MTEVEGDVRPGDHAFTEHDEDDAPNRLEQEKNFGAPNCRQSLPGAGTNFLSPVLLIAVKNGFIDDIRPAILRPRLYFREA